MRAGLQNERTRPADEHQFRNADGALLERALKEEFSAAGSVGLERLGVPVFLMNAPLSLSARIPNNAWMEQMTEAEREIDADKAIEQFIALYRKVASAGLVYLLPSAPGLQDQTYVSNLGVVLRHSDDATIIASRFRSSVRVAEADIGADFFRLMNFRVYVPPAHIDGEPVYLEGDADVIHVRENLYIGAHGLRTSLNALEWAASSFGMNIVPFRVENPLLYHLDCCLFPVTPDTVLLCTEAADPKCLAEVERYCSVVDVTLEEACAGITNGIILGDQLLCDSDLFELNLDSRFYAAEKAKVERLEKISAQFGLGFQIINMSEFYKSGALLSCLVLRLC